MSGFKTVCKVVADSCGLGEIATDTPTYDAGLYEIFGQILAAEGEHAVRWDSRNPGNQAGTVDSPPLAPCDRGLG